MRHDAFWLTASDAAPLYVNHWSPEQPPRAVVMLAHGMAEHSGRYARFGEALASAGFALYGHDQRGHGRTAQRGVLGHYADHDGWQRVIADLANLNHHIRQQHPDAPIFLLGHSMGSYIGQAYLMRHSCSLQGAILSGSNFQPPALYRAARQVARFERWRQGPVGRSALIEFLSFGSFNKAFKPNRTAFDWLSRDPDEVDKYVTDPLCGFRCTNQLWIDLLGGLEEISQEKNLAQIDHDLPLLVVGGARDPVSQGVRLEKLADALCRAGLRNVQLKLYPDARHELLNESNRDEVTAYLIDWLERTLVAGRHCPLPTQEIA
ncbi:alpha/beta hydrolase [Pseudomonas indica]|uniref:alpha/beta hydrolase n=1 Tax=Pseudomonas indica TaxID=137658 RepID=UPI000BABE24B|nr:alpha/beta hydrolase [Pseudomonas indica]MBU3057042.1 alpha/beta hydrolase [Pseudomonas indica]PAU64196.1 alpha/beta hydrolase [Pseudomonas indica]